MKPAVAEKLAWSYKKLPFCGICQNHIPRDEIPVTIVRDDGFCAQLCGYCGEESFEVAADA